MSATQKKHKYEFITTLLVALVCAGIVRSFLFEPFHIPSSSMKPNLLIGDYIFVSKYSYGYSRYSFPFGFKFNYFEGRVFKQEPTRGDIAVFRTPQDTSINYVKRIIGLPGDKIQVSNGTVYINYEPIKKEKDGNFIDSDSGIESRIPMFEETLPNGKIIKILDEKSGMPQDNTGIYEVPPHHYFVMGDNRDNSQDSRFLTELGYIPEENLVGRASIIFFSNEKPTWQFWNWPTSIRFNRILHQVK